MKKRVIYLQVFARLVSPLVTLIVTIFSLLPSSSLPPTILFFSFSDKILHLIAYIAVSGTISIALAKTDDNWTAKEYVLSNSRRLIVTFIVVFAIGSMIEIVQPMFNRGREVLDLVFNSMGSIVGIILGMTFLFIVQRSCNGKEII